MCNDFYDKARPSPTHCKTHHADRYVRVSTDDQDLALLRAALTEAGCKRSFEEKISGGKRDRPELARMLDGMREGDVAVVTQLDRYACSIRNFPKIAERLKEGSAGMRSLADPWADTTSPAGWMVLTVFAGIAELERSLIHERTSSGRIAARATGERFDRQSALTGKQVVLGQRLIGEGQSVREIARPLPQFSIRDFTGLCNQFYSPLYTFKTSSIVSP